MIPSWEIEPGATFEGRKNKLYEVLSVDREHEQVRYKLISSGQISISHLLTFQRWITNEVEV